MGAKKPAATVSGPGVDRSFASPAVALSAAMTIASRAPGETTLYVRDADGNVYGSVVRAAQGGLTVYRTDT